MSPILKNLPVGAYAVIFPSISSGVDENGHEDMLAIMYENAQKVEGYLGLESASIGGFTLSIAYYESLEAIDTWRKNSDHIAAKNKARSTWLEDWQIRICKIENIYGKH
jgi:heme-degrading monooxygenase HmoA